MTMVWLVAEEILNHISMFISELVKSHTGFVDQYQITFLSVDDYIVHSVAEVRIKIEHHSYFYTIICDIVAGHRILECLQRREVFSSENPFGRWTH